jgi:uncharacterized protein
MTEQSGGQGHVTFHLKHNAAAFEYRFDHDTELSGPMTLRLRVAVTGTDDPRLFVGVEKRSHGVGPPARGLHEAPDASHMSQFLHPKELAARITGTD